MSTPPGPQGQRIAAEIRAEMGRQDLSRRALADRIGLNHVSVSRWVKGDGPMTLEAFLSICSGLGVSVGEMLDRASDNGHASSRNSGRYANAA